MTTSPKDPEETMAPPHRRVGPSAPLRAVFAIAVTALVAGCASGTGTGSGSGSGSEGAHPPEMEHIHGLGVDPADGVLYAGTHYGLFRIPVSGQPSRVGDHVQDFMGFTVVGPNHFLASGHPGEGQGGPSSVGLIESTDAGQTWQPMSLSGEADFHSLDSVEGAVYGLNSMTGQLMASSDGRTWEVRSAEAIADFAVDPKTPLTLVATTQQGPVISTDGGATFKALPSAPLVVLVDWAPDGTLVAVAPDGAVYGSEDGGLAWEARGKLAGPPEAVDVEDADTIYAAANGQVFRSSDGGATFIAVDDAS